MEGRMEGRMGGMTVGWLNIHDSKTATRNLKPETCNPISNPKSQSN